MLIAAAATASSCLVLGLDRFYDDTDLTFDVRLVGTWIDADDNVTATIERSEWRSYRVTFTHPTESGVLTGYLFQQGGRQYLDLTPVRGQDQGSFVLPAHAVLRVAIGDGEVEVSALSYDWFSEAMASGLLPASLPATKSDRDQIVLAATGAALRRWLEGRVAADPAFGPPATFTRKARGATW
jgi:hypothetical protein